MALHGQPAALTRHVIPDLTPQHTWDSQPDDQWLTQIATLNPEPLLTRLIPGTHKPSDPGPILLSFVAAAVAVVQLGVRWRRGGARPRQQIALLGAAAVLPIAASPLSMAGLGGPWLFAVTLLPLPLVVGFAVLARGLYDLSTAANRTLVWLTLSATVVAIYALVIAGVGSILDVRGARWLPWVGAAAVAVSFSPLRDLLQRSVNRLIFGRWDDPYEVLATLGQQLEASADLDRLLSDVVTELETTLNLAHASIHDESGQLLAGGPEQTNGAMEIGLVAFHRPVGTLRYATTSPLRTEDGKLLDDLAGHLGGLLHTHRLNRELQRARERLVLAREEERRRLRRDLHDGLGPALAGHLMRLDLAGRQLPADSPARRTVEALRTEMQTTMVDVRRVV